MTTQLDLGHTLKTSGFQRENMVNALFEARRKNNEKFTLEQAEQEVDRFMGDSQVIEDARVTLNRARHSPMVSRETQVAHLKGIILDYEAGKRRPGLTAIAYLKAIELLNKMTGYEEPQKVEVKHDVQVNVFPVVPSAFKGELPPLDVIDVDGDAVSVNREALPEGPKEDIIDVEAQDLSEIEETSDELFP